MRLSSSTATTVVRVRRGSILALAIVVLAGCGGGSGKALSKAEYASKADAICGKYTQQTKALGNPSSIKELASIADKALPILDHAISDLKKLKPPADEQALVDQWLVQVGLLKQDLQEIRDKAKAGDLAGVQALVPTAQQHNSKSNQLAATLGMSVCNKD
jgi:hypothetical protein